MSTSNDIAEHVAYLRLDCAHYFDRSRTVRLYGAKDADPKTILLRPYPMLHVEESDTDLFRSLDMCWREWFANLITSTA